MEDTKELQIIYVEDIVSDALRVENALRKQNVRFQLRRVDTRQEFLDAISLHPPDVILSDHGLPEFDGFSALSLTKQICPKAPFIFVTSALTPDMDVEKLVGQVADFISKSRLELLGPAILKAWRRADTRRSPELTAEERADLIRRLLVLLANTDGNQGYIPICSDCRKVRDPNGLWQSSDVFFRDYLQLYFTHGLCDDCLPKYAE
jgi:DNA-binding NtrC family response regulator